MVFVWRLDGLALSSYAKGTLKVKIEFPAECPSGLLPVRRGRLPGSWRCVLQALVAVEVPDEGVSSGDQRGGCHVRASAKPGHALVRESILGSGKS